MWRLFLFVLLAVCLVPFPAVFISLTPSLRDLIPAIPTITACITLLLGWLFTSYQNSINFFRSETVKHKDKLISSIENFFDDFIEKLESRTFTEQERSIFVSDKVSNLEFKHSIQQRIYGKKAIVFLSDETFAKLRMIWQIDDKDFKKQKRQIQELKDDVLQEIENNYIKWLK